MTKSRIDHIVIGIKPENLETCREKLEQILDLEFEYAEREDLGVNIYTDWDAGIELLSPSSPDSAFWEQLNAKGEGILSVVVAVEDIDRTKQKAQKAGIGHYPEVGLRGDEPWAERFDLMRESSLDPVFGIGLILAQLKRKDR